jgi:hypothetical protein
MVFLCSYILEIKMHVGMDMLMEIDASGAYQRRMGAGASSASPGRAEKNGGQITPACRLENVGRSRLLQLIFTDSPATGTLVLAPIHGDEDQSRQVTQKKTYYHDYLGRIVIGQPGFHLPFVSAGQAFAEAGAIVKVSMFVDGCGTTCCPVFFPGGEANRTAYQDKQQDNDFH